MAETFPWTRGILKSEHNRFWYDIEAGEQKKTGKLTLIIMILRSVSHAIEWCVRSGQARNIESAKVSMPGHNQIFF